MPADVQIRFKAQSAEARREINQLTQEVRDLHQGLGQTDRSATAATQGVGRLGTAAQTAASGVTSLSRNIFKTGAEANQVLETLRAELSRYSASVASAEANANTYAFASQLLTASQEALTASIRAADAAFRDGALRYGEYVAAAARVREHIEALSGGQAVLNDFWRVASGQIDNYAESIQTTVPSVVNLTEAEASLTAAMDANLGLINPSVKGLESYGEQADAIGGSLENLQRRTHAHNAALVNPAVSRATEAIRAYSEALDSTQFSSEAVVEVTEGATARLSEFARQALTTEGVIGNFANRLGETENTYISLESVSGRLTGAIRDQSSAFDTLRGSVGGVSEASEKLSGELLDINDALDDLDRSVQASSGELDLVTGIFDTLSDQTEIFQDLAVTAFDELSRSVRSAGNEIDTVGESILAVSDLAARIATGDISALLQVPFRIADINAQQDRIAQHRRQERRDEATDFRTQVGVSDQNLSILARALGIPVGRFDISQAPHSLQGLQSINDFTGTPLEDLSRNLLSGRTDIAGGISASIERAIQNSNLDQDIARSITTLAANLDRAMTGADIDTIFQSRLEALRNELDQAAFNLDFARQTGGDVEGALNAVIGANTALYHAQIDAYNLQRQALGYAVGNVEELNRTLNELNNEARLQITGRTRGSFYQEYLQRRQNRTSEEIDAEYLATFVAGDPNAQLPIRGGLDSESRDLVTPETLENVIAAINADIGRINAAITSIETQIGQASEPNEIAAFLDRIPELIATKYQRLRDELDARYNAGTIGVDVYNASLSELESSESREVEAHSDAVLANTVRAINEDVQRIDASITAIETQISQTSEPDEIIGLLSQIPGRITEKYQKLRDALDARYAAGEISVDVYNASLTALGSSQAADIERHSDAVLAQVIGEIDDTVDRIDANIGALQVAVEQSDDPAVIAGVLEAIKALIMDKYKRLRERLDALYAAEEISTTAYNAALTALGTGETRALANIDAQAFQEISEKAQEHVNLINSSIDNLRLSLELTDDPEAIQGILEAIKVLTANRFDVLIQELKDIEESLDPEQFDRALEGLQLGKQVALQNIDTELLNAVSAEARRQVDLINGSIGNLRLALQLTDEPAEIEQILNSIKILTAARFDILIQELKDIEASLDPEEFKIALDGLELGKQVALQGIGQEIANAFPPPQPIRIPPFQPPTIDVDPFQEISEAAQRQANFINEGIENLRLSLQLTEDPAEIQQILDAIKTLTAARFDVLIQELHDIRASLEPEEFEQSLEGLELGKRLALENIDTEKFAEISAEADKQVSRINGNIENLRLSLQLTDDPTQRQQILDAIKVLVGARFRILREELEAIKESLDPEVYEQTLTGINLGEQLAIQNIDIEKFQVISDEARKQVDLINGNIENLRRALQLTDDLTKQQEILTAIKVLTVARFRILREELEAIKDSLDPEVFDQALRGLNLGEQLALENLDTEKFDGISAAAKAHADFINGSIENLRLALQLTDDPAEVQAILDSIKILTAKRFDVLIQGLKDIEDSFNDPALFAQALEGLELGKQVALQNIDTENIGVTLTGIGEQISDTDSEMTQLFDELGEQTTVAGVREAVNRLRAAITTKYQLMRDTINASAEKEEEKARQIAAVNISEGRELEQLDERGLGQFNSLVDTAQFLLDTATEADFGARRQDLINAINDFYDERIAFINGLDLSDTDRANMLEVARIQRNIALEAIPEMHASVVERLRLAQELHDDIEDLEAQRERNAEDRDQRLQDLAKDHQDRLTEIEERGLRDREDLQRDFNRSIEDVFRDAGLGEEFFLSGDFQDILRLSQIPGQQALQERLDALGIDLSGDDLERIRDRAVSRLRAQENVGIRQQRAEADAAARADEQRQNALAQAEVIAAAIRTELAPLLQPELAIETPLNTETGTAEVQAGVDQDTAFSDIDPTEIEDIDAINAQSIADRLETDAAITEARDQYIKARDTEIFKQNTAILQVNTAEAADIKAVRETLSKNLESIDEKLDLELAEIREQTIAFDARMNALITAINEQANQDVSSLKEDTAAMRSSLEAIAAEAKDNEWKSALLKIASTGITIAGVAAGAAVGPPVAGVAVGQAAGGLVEEAGNELFHYERTDRIARNVARQSAFRNSRPVPNYLPDANQIRNARDVSKEIVAGLTEGLQQRERGSFGDASEQAGFPEELSATIVLQFPDGSVQELRDQMVRLEQQDR